MMEFVTTFGFPSWKTIEHPCPLCHCTRRDWDKIIGLSPLALPWPSKTWADYVSACRSCERWVVVTTLAQLYRLRAALFYDKRKANTASRGRALRVDIPDLQLLAGDRLEPHPKMPDVGAIDNFKAVPIELLFWRRSCETMTRHRNPLFDEDLGITAEETFVPDWLHALSLGVYQRIISWVWHKLFEINVFDVSSWRKKLWLILSYFFFGLPRRKFARDGHVWSYISDGHIIAIIWPYMWLCMAIYGHNMTMVWQYMLIIWPHMRRAYGNNAIHVMPYIVIIWPCTWPARRTFVHTPSWRMLISELSCR